MWKGTWKNFYSLFLPLPLPPPLTFLSSSAWPLTTSPPPSSLFLSGSSSISTSSSSPSFNSAVTLYKALAFLALLSLIPSIPQSSIITAASMIKEADLQKIFKIRNENEWKSLWHQEKHVRCRDQLLLHMDWACQKDIYRLEKRFQRVLRPSRETPTTSGNVSPGNDPFGQMFLRKSLANTVIKPWSGYIRRKREEKSITDECCSAAGCTWEEYAEYCPAHRRVQK